MVQRRREERTILNGRASHSQRRSRASRDGAGDDPERCSLGRMLGCSLIADGLRDEERQERHDECGVFGDGKQDQSKDLQGLSAYFLVLICF